MRHRADGDFDFIRIADRPSLIYSAHVGSGLTGILLRGLFAAACLLPPTILMGATLPAMARRIESTPHGVSWLGFFYGGNIAGAVFGCLFAGFYLLRVHDSSVATFVAAAINGTVALAAVALSISTRFEQQVGAQVSDTARIEKPARARGRRSRKIPVAGVCRDCAFGNDGDWRGSGLDAVAVSDAWRNGLCLFHHSGRVSFRAGHRQRRRLGAGPQKSAARNFARLVPVLFDGGDFLDGLHARGIAAILAD